MKEYVSAIRIGPYLRKAHPKNGTIHVLLFFVRLDRKGTKDKKPLNVWYEKECSIL